MTTDEKVRMIAERISASSYPHFNQISAELQEQVIRSNTKAAIALLPMFLDEFRSGWKGATAYAVLRVKGEPTIGKSFTDKASFRGLFQPRVGGAITGKVQHLISKVDEMLEYGQVVDMEPPVTPQVIDVKVTLPKTDACCGDCQNEYCEKW